jgi:hypothetical protein
MSVKLRLMLVAGMLAAPAGARADTTAKLRCVQANENAQVLRRDGRLRDARAKLVECESMACPSLVREDCVLQLADVDQAIPTLTFDVRDTAGNELRGVRVSVDGVPAGTFEGNPVPVDPGERVFRFEADGRGPVETTLGIREGEKNRRERVVLRVPTSPSARSRESVGATQRTIGILVGGTGAAATFVGAIFGVESKATYNAALSHCQSGPTSCDPQGVQGGSDAHSQASISTVALLLGGAAVGAGAFGVCQRG